MGWKMRLKNFVCCYGYRELKWEEEINVTTLYNFLC